MRLTLEEKTVIYQAISQTLGLDSSTISSFELVALTRKGIPKSAIDALAKSLYLSISELTKYLHISERTLQRYSPDKSLSTELSDHVLQIALGNIAPMEYLDTSSGIEIVLDELTRIE